GSRPTFPTTSGLSTRSGGPWADPGAGVNRLALPAPAVVEDTPMTDALLWHRLQFAFTITYHYLFPQLTMGLALLIVALKVVALRTGNERYNEVTRFWARIFGINFAMGVVTGIPLEFQFGTNWARLSSFAGEIIGQT